MKTLYIIDTPPETCSGNIHIGHIFSYTQADLIAQYQKYLGKELLYPHCLDNNGLPTYKLASNKGIKETKDIINFSLTKGEEYKSIFQLAGIEFSNHSYHTYNDLSIKIAYKIFDTLKSRNIIYKKECDYMWSDILKTSISESELDDNGLIEKTGEIPIIKRGFGWFINIKDHINNIKEMGNKIEWRPLKYKKRFDDWCDNIKWDWSISRERKFGIEIPNEPFTFDTWFVSSLTPFINWSTYKGYESIDDCPTFDMRFQSHDIIRSWCFYTIAMSYFIKNDIPWKNIMITGHTLDGKGDKYSKSSGNATNPINLIKNYGPEGIRFWAFSNTLGMDTKIDESKMKMGWKIKNKIKNAEKFIDMQISNKWIGENNEYINTWNNCKKEIFHNLDNFNIDKSSQLLYSFFWDIFCSDWIEKSKNIPTSLTLKSILSEIKEIMHFFFKI